MEDHSLLDVTNTYSMNLTARKLNFTSDFDSSQDFPKERFVMSNSSLRLEPDLLKKLKVDKTSFITKNEAYFPRNREELKEMRK